MNRRTFFANILAATTLLATSGCVKMATPAATQKIRLPMGYIPNVQYAPYYVAVDKGYFAAEGIELEFDYKFETDGVKLVAAGELPFAVVSGEQVVLARANGLPVKYVAQWYRDYPVAIFSLKEKGIVNPADLKGKTVGLPGLFGATYVGWKAFMAANDLKDDDVKVSTIGFTQIAAVQQGKVDAAVGYSVNEPVVLEKQGVAVNVMPISPQVDMVANGLLTSDKVASGNPALVKAFVRAIVKGIKDTINNPDEAMRITTKYVDGLKADDPVQKAVLAATVANMKGDGQAPIGQSSAASWANTQDVLIAIGMTKNRVDVNTLYTNEFLP